MILFLLMETVHSVIDLQEYFQFLIKNEFKIYPLDSTNSQLNTVVLYRYNKFFLKYEAISECMKQLNIMFKVVFSILHYC